MKYKKAVLSQGNRAIPQLFFSVKFVDDKFKSIAKLRKPSFRVPNIPAQTEFNTKCDSRSFKVACFVVSAKAVRY